MNGLEKVELLEKIGVELQKRMTFDEIDIYFTSCGIDCSHEHVNVNSKRVYAKDVLKKQDEEVIIKIADELKIPHTQKTSPNAQIPSPKKAIETNFWTPGYFKLFLSHVSGFKKTTSQLEFALKKYAISGFVAHEDIEPSLEWQTEIEAALKSMDALVAILMEGFKESSWCDQEVGAAVARDVLVIPVMRGLNPYGFIGKYQGIQAQNTTVDDVAKRIFKTIVRSSKTHNLMVNAIMNAISQSTNVDDALEKLNLINSIDEIQKTHIENLKLKVKENNVLIESDDFVCLINKLLEKFQIGKIETGYKGQIQDWDKLPF